MTRRSTWLSAVAFGLCALLAVIAAPARADDQALMATATPNAGKPGTQLRIVGSGWPAQTQLQLSTCGGLAIEGSVACDQRTIGIASTTSVGGLQALVMLGKPPTACPCVLRVAAFGTDKAVNIPVRVIGHPSGPLPDLPAAPSTVHIVGSAVGAPFSWPALFGAAAPRVLAVTYSNTGAVSAVSPQTSVTVEPVGGASSALPEPQAIAVPPGETRTVEVPFELDAGIGGTYLVRGTVPGQPGFSHQTSSWAWGFFALDTLLFLLLLLVLAVKIARGRDPMPRRGTRHAGRSSTGGVAVSAGRHWQFGWFPLTRGSQVRTLGSRLTRRFDWWNAVRSG